MKLLAFFSDCRPLSALAQHYAAAPSPAGQADPAAAAPPAARAASEYARARLDLDLAAVQSYRPEYPFWQHIFTIPDGRIAFGSAQDGRLLAVFPTAGDWARDADWEEQALARDSSTGETLPKQLESASRRGRSPAHANDRPARAQPDARTVPDAERPALRKLPPRVGHDLRALRRAGRDRTGPGDSRIRAGRPCPLARARPGLLPIAQPQLGRS